MKTPIFRTIAGLALLAIAALVQNSASAATLTWSGSSSPTSNLWSSGGATGNWSGAAAPVNTNALVFSGTNNLATYDNLAPLTSSTFAGITFSAGAGPFVLSGSSITLSAAISDVAYSLETINNNLVLPSGTTGFGVGSPGAYLGGC